MIHFKERPLHDLARESRKPGSFAIAHTVGYAETAVLSRAFKLWTGASPRAFLRRERHAAAGIVGAGAACAVSVATGPLNQCPAGQ